ncbi:MAG: FIST C-terminal domain-containing protein [Ilumatobacteraceae bacterium]|nr:FIST C-terminal domain-containing protein [Ilumatobacter sp.]MCO5331186.1 FIST C-terminal domain-containing protein [Ilumatobacteraceae bacterium]
MLEFLSANTRAVNAERAVMEALERAYGAAEPTCDLVLVNAAVGHDLEALSNHISANCRGARVLAASCAGVVGRDGPGESLHDIAVMVLRGDGATVAHVDGLYGATSFEKGAELGRALAAAPLPVTMVYLLASGIDIANDRLIDGIESVLGPDVVIFGATSSDQMQGIATFQAVDGRLHQHSAFAVGIWDPTLQVDTQATHGFVATGDPLIVTAADGNRIIEIDGRPAWPEYLRRMGLPDTATEADTIPIGALAEALPPDLAAEYGNDHILRVVTHHSEAGEIIYATECSPGTPLWLTVRDEQRIFDDMDRMMVAMGARCTSCRPIAVFQADCLARGRRLFNRVMKEELVHRMQQPLADLGVVPPWFGMYGFGEYARLGGRNAYHNYTTSLAALYRRTEPASP